MEWGNTVRCIRKIHAEPKKIENCWTPCRCGITHVVLLKIRVAHGGLEEDGVVHLLGKLAAKRRLPCANVALDDDDGSSAGRRGESRHRARDHSTTLLKC